MLVDGELWEETEFEGVDSMTGKPPDFTGHGMATISGDHLNYIDDKGKRLTFVRDDGRRPTAPPPACA